jgi:phytoene dehydrogenase-like protein
MRNSHEFDAAVVGSGPNGLAAATLLAQHGLKVIVLEGANSFGGAVRSEALTLPGFIHDIGAAILPTSLASPFFSSLQLSRFGLQWITPPAALAHPFDDGTAAMLKHSITETALTLAEDSASYIRLIGPLASRWSELTHVLMGTMRLPQHPLVMMAFGWQALQSAGNVVSKHFSGNRASGFFAGMAAHSVVPLETVPSAAYGLVMLLAGHGVGWPVPAGGAGSITSSLIAHLETLGGKLISGYRVNTAADLPDAEAIFYDTSPRQLIGIYGDKLPGSYRKALGAYSYGPGVFKIDWALSGPVPWKAKDCSGAATVHLGGTFSEIAASESAPWHGRTAEKPFVILVQPSLFDPSRAPSGKHTAWAYCHVPNGCAYDMTAQIEKQVDRFAPGFMDLIIARHISTPATLESVNPNLVGGDIVGGAQTFGQMICRPVCRLVPYSVPIKGVFLCSASTPPGAGVHGMCGFHAASAYLKSRHRELM